MAKLKEKEKAIALRRRGLSYSEIQEKVPVSKAILSDWLRDIRLSTKQENRLRKKILAGHEVAWEKIRNRRIEKTKIIKCAAAAEIGTLSFRDLWLTGISLYWAEGSKAKEYNVSQRVTFSNSDPRMINLFLDWLKKCALIDKSRIQFSLYVHVTAKKRIHIIKRYWSSIVGNANELIMYYKQGRSKSYRKNRGNGYYGVLRITVLRSSELNRKISGWIEGICANI